MRAGWEIKPLGEVCRLINGRAYKKPELLEAGPYPVLRVGNFFTNNHWYYSDLELDDDKYCDDGDLLYAWSASFGPRIWKGGKVIYHYHIWKVVPLVGQLDKRFLYYFFDWDKERIKDEQGAGTTMVHVSKRSMDARAIPLPPLEEQKRIVAVLDAAFEGLTRARTHIETNLQNARELFERAANSQLTASENANLVALSEVASIPSRLVDPRLPEFLDQPHVGAGNMETGRDVLVDVKTSREEGLKSGKYTFDGTMVLYSKIRPYLRKVARPEFEGLCSADMYPLLPDNLRLDRNFLFHLLLSDDFTEYAIGGSDRAGMPKVNQTHLFKYKFPLPSLERQRMAVEVIDRAMVQSEILQSHYRTKLQDLDDLRQSLLQKAFAGELT